MGWGAQLSGAKHAPRLYEKGDLAFFYHSSCEVPGIAGIVSVVKSGYPDETAFDRKHHHYDPESRPSDPRWYVIDVKFRRKFNASHAR